MGPTVGKAAEFDQQTLKHTFNIRANLRVCETKCLVSTVLVDSIADGIVDRIVGIAVHFDNQSFLGTEEIDNAVADDVLSAELIAVKLRPAKMRPKLRFEWAAVLPQLLRSIDKVCVLLQRHSSPLPLP